MTALGLPLELPLGLPLWLQALLALLLVAGAVLALIGSWSLVWLDDFWPRLHGPSLLGTGGLGCILLASMLASVWTSVHFTPSSFYEVLIGLFLCLTTPVSAHFLALAALHGARPPQHPLGVRNLDPGRAQRAQNSQVDE